MIKEGFKTNGSHNSEELGDIIDETTGCFVSISWNGKVWYTPIGDFKIRVEHKDMNLLCGEVSRIIRKHRIAKKKSTKRTKKKYTFNGIVKEV